jgi:hypothetical protein
MFKECFAGIPCPQARDFPLIDVGNDSRVLRVPNEPKVVKKYCGRDLLNMAEGKMEWVVRTYVEATNRAYDLTTKKDIVFRFPFSGGNYLLKVNPVISLDKCRDCGFMETESPFIGGNYLALCTDRFDLKELPSALRKASSILERNLGLMGIGLVPANVKCFEDTLVITDLCSNITSLWLSKGFESQDDRLYSVV